MRLQIKKSSIDELKDKITFVKRISDAIGGYPYISIESLDYDVFFSEYGSVEEFLVVTYKGGAIAVRSCNWNSLSAIFDEIARLFNGGYYDEVSYYNRLKEKSVSVFDESVEII